MVVVEMFISILMQRNRDFCSHPPRFRVGDFHDAVCAGGEEVRAIMAEGQGATAALVAPRSPCGLYRCVTVFGGLGQLVELDVA